MKNQTNSLKQIIFAGYLVGLTSLASAEPKVEIQKIAGKTPEEVAKVLGKPSSRANTKQGRKLIYEGQIEVVFIDGKADWITVSNLGDIPFAANAIEALGIKPNPPTFKNDFLIRWEPCGPYNSISIFNANGRVDYAFVKAVTR